MDESTYDKKDIEQAYNMGFDAAVKVFENAIHIRHERNRFIIDKLREYIIEEKVQSLQKSLCRHSDI